MTPTSGSSLRAWGTTYVGTGDLDVALRKRWGSDRIYGGQGP